ncbi:MAG: 3'-5' exonuclease [Planctomycetaceae bacterium]
MRYVIADLEATCWENVRHSPRMETIEIGAVRLASAVGPADGEFSEFVRPIASPKLSPFCISLTSIRQEDVDSVEYFWSVFPRFVEWCGPEPFVFCSWGSYDLGQLRADCDRHGMAFPAALECHINLKKEFARLRGEKVRGMARALKAAGLSLEGTHHRAIDDARNIARLALLILSALETEGGVPD